MAPAVTTPTTTEPIIAARGVTRAFDDRTVVNALSFDVYPGTILGVIGPSGSGKTTTIRMLTGTLARTDGVIRVLDEDPMHFTRDVRGRLAYMPQLFSLYEDLTAEENVGFVAALYGIGPFSRGKLIDEALRVVDLTDARHRRARDLSGGMQRRLELACALVHQPEVLFVDEPTAGIDPLLRTAIWTELRRLRDEMQKNHAALTQLSMGMTNDFRVAIEEGSTCVRVGTAIFGKRVYAEKTGLEKAGPEKADADEA